jgi:hypothetical protein
MPIDIPSCGFIPGRLHTACRDVDDPAEASRNHSVNHCADQKDRRKHIGVDRADPVFERHVPKVTNQWLTRIIDWNVRIRREGASTASLSSSAVMSAESE